MWRYMAKPLQHQFFYSTALTPSDLLTGPPCVTKDCGPRKWRGRASVESSRLAGC